MVIQNKKKLDLVSLEFLNDNQTKVNILRSFELDIIKGTIHAGLFSRNASSIFLIDELNFYKFDLASKTSKIFEDQNSLCTYLSDGNYLYTISKSSVNSDARQAGFRVYDIENLISKDEDYSYLLTQNDQIGQLQSFIDFSFINQRLIYISSYLSLVVVPILHRNSIAYIGMDPRSKYLAVRQLGDKVAALQ